MSDDDDLMFFLRAGAYLNKKTKWMFDGGWIGWLVVHILHDSSGL